MQRKGWEGDEGGMFPSGRGERERGKTQKRGRGERGGKTSPGARPSSWKTGLASVLMCSMLHWWRCWRAKELTPVLPADCASRHNFNPLAPGSSVGLPSKVSVCLTHIYLSQPSLLVWLCLYLLKIYFMCLSVCLHALLCNICVQCLFRPEEGVGWCMLCARCPRPSAGAVNALNCGVMSPPLMSLLNDNFLPG